MPVNELEAAITLARKAGAAVLEHYAREIISENKIGVDNLLSPLRPPTARPAASSSPVWQSFFRTMRYFPKRRSMSPKAVWSDNASGS